MNTRQQLRTIGSALAATCLTLITLPAFAQDYHANDLTPPSSPTGKLTGAASGTQVGGSGNGHAMVLTGNALTAVDLHPAGYYLSMATSTDGVQQCGYGYLSVGGTHAMAWSGSAASAVDLNPSGYNFSYCSGVQNGQQVGFAENQTYFITASHALLWSGTAGSVVDLHPGTFPYSRAMGLHDGEQVGYGSSFAYPYGDTLAYHATSHALRWAGTAASAVDLHPAGYGASEALATNGLQQGGWGYLALGTSHLHALLWNGSAADFVDLHPAGYTDSRVTALTATQQVGEGWVGTPGMAGSVRHALLWSGTAASVVDLNQYLPAGYLHAVATGIDANGNVVGYAYNTYYQGAFVLPDAIAVVFAPGAPPASTIFSLSLTPSSVAPGDVVNGLVSLSGTAPVGGVPVVFLSTAPALAATPASVVIPEGASSAAFTLPVLGAGLTVPATAKVYASDGTVSRVSSLTVTPVVKLAAVTVNAVEGGFATNGTLSLNIPAQFGGADVTLTSGTPALVAVPATVTLPQGYQVVSFLANTTSVSASTVVPITASFNGTTASGSVTLSQAPVVALASFSVFPTVVGGQSIAVTVNLTNFPRSAGGAVVTLSSGDAGTLQLPATVTVPQGSFSATFVATTVVVPGIKGVSVKAVYNGTSVNTTIMVNPIPTVSIISAEYLTDLQLFKVQASTSYANSVLTYGTDPTSPPLGTMQLELGVWKGSMLMATAPAFATVWNSNGGSATLAVTVRTSGGGAGGGSATGGGGGGGGTSSTFKISISKTGKGTVTANPNAASYASGTVVTLTATPDPGSPWVGWGGACSGTAATCTVTMNANLSVTANFK